MKYNRCKVDDISLRLALLTCLFICSCGQRVQKDKDLASLYSNVEKKYFKETFFDAGKTVKWDKSNIKFSIQGEFSESQIKLIHSTLNYISTLKGLPKFKYGINDANIKFIMTRSEEGFRSNKGDHWRGFTAQKMDFFNKKLISSEIRLKPSLSDTEIRMTLQHELLHALGLSGHPTSSFPFSSALGIRHFYTLEPEISPRIPEIDSKALILLYDKKLTNTITEIDFSILLDIK